MGAVCTRLESMGEILTGYRARLQKGIDEGETVAKRQVLAVAEQRRVAASADSAYEGLVKELAGTTFEAEHSERLRRRSTLPRSSRASSADG